jgi:hypothetical protein
MDGNGSRNPHLTTPPVRKCKARPAPKNCHPDRSFSYPKGMRSGVEGPAVWYLASNGSGNKKKADPRECSPPSLASKERTRTRSTGLNRRIVIPAGTLHPSAKSVGVSA